MIKTIEELEANEYPTVRFPDGNQVGYFMDFGFWRGLPSDRDFYIVKRLSSHKSKIELVARGYGVQGDYGNGSIFMSESDVPLKLKNGLA